MSSAYLNNNELQLTDSAQNSCYSLPNFSNIKEVKNRDTFGSESIDADPDDIFNTATNGPLNVKSSILRSKLKFPNKERKDSYGVIITPEIKQHKIKFKDAVREVKVVDNWKEYNVIEERPCCICNII